MTDKATTDQAADTAETDGKTPVLDLAGVTDAQLDAILKGLDDAQVVALAEAQRDAITGFDVKNADDVSAVNEMKGVYLKLHAAVASRSEAAAVAAAQAAKDTLGDLPTLPATATVDGETSGGETTDANTDSADSADSGSDGSEAGMSDTAARELVLAAAAKVMAGTDVATGQDPADQQTAAEADTRPKFASAMEFRNTGGAGLPMGKATGLADLIQGLATRTPAATSGRVVLASARTDTDPATLLTVGNRAGNERIIAQNLAEFREARRDTFTTNTDVRLAAICDPATVLRDVRAAGTDATPVSDEFSWLTGESGNALKYEYREPMSLTAAETGVGVWTSTDQTAVDPADPDTWKPVASLACPDYTEVTAEELVAGWEADSWTEYSSPEARAELESRIRHLQARFRDGWLLRELGDRSHALTYDGPHGAIPDLIAAVEYSLFYATYGERLVDGDYTLVIPPDLMRLLVVDGARVGNPIAPARSEAEIRADIEHATGVRTVVARDLALDTDGTLPTSPYPAIPAVGAAAAAIPTTWKDGTRKFRLYLADPTAFQPFTTGEATFGQQVTLDQARQNKRGLFMAEYVGLMKPGIAPAFTIDFTATPNGGRAGFVTADAAAAG